MSHNISSQDKKDLEKFCKFFCVKSSQVIVQARLGKQITTQCNTSASGTEWFNLAIKDYPDIQKESKSALSNGIPNTESSFMVEISLHTSERETLLLELWSVSFTRKFEDTKVHYTIYNRMSLLLKSLMCVCRATPAYKLSQNQGPEFVICYRVFMGKVDVIGLGEGLKTLRVGSVGSPIGTLTLSAAYRAPESLHVSTKNLIPRRNFTPLQLHSEHFSSPKGTSSYRPKPCANLTSKIKSCTIESSSYSQLPTSFCTSPLDNTDDGTEGMFTLGTPPVVATPYKNHNVCINQNLASRRVSYSNANIPYSTSEQVFQSSAKVVKNLSKCRSLDKGTTNGKFSNEHGDIPKHKNFNNNQLSWKDSMQQYYDKKNKEKFEVIESKKQPINVVVGFPDNAGLCTTAFKDNSNQLKKKLCRDSIKSFKGTENIIQQPPCVGAFVNGSKTASRAYEALNSTQEANKLPFYDLMQMKDDDLSDEEVIKTTIPRHDAQNTSPAKDSDSSTTNSPDTLHGLKDDFVLVELNAAFGKSNSASDLGTFYRECENAPDLLMFQQNGNENEETLLDLTKHLEDYERDIEDFDHFVQDLEAKT